MKKTLISSFLSPINGTVTLWEVNGYAQAPDEVNYRYFLITSTDHKVTRTSQRRSYAVNIYNTLRTDALSSKRAW